MTELQTQLPVYSIPKILQLRDKLAEALVPRYSSVTLADSEDIELVIQDLRELLPERVSEMAIRNSVYRLLGGSYDDQWWRGFAWLLAGNLSSLYAGRAVAPWRAPGVQEWVPMQITSVAQAPSHKGESQYQFNFRVLAGTPSGLLFQKRFSGAWLARLSRFVGFTKRNGPRPYRSPYQYANLRWFGLLDPTLSRGDQPNFFEVRCAGSAEEHNTRVLGWRNRRGSFVCPRNFTHDCHQCPIGYLSCKAGTHREDYLWRACHGCSEMAWFDPEVSTEVCIDCWRKRTMSPKS